MRQEYIIGKSLISKLYWENWTAAYKSVKLEHIPHTMHKNKLKMA